MKYINSFEKYYDPDSYKIGDKILCKDDYLKKLEKGSIYEIEDIQKSEYFTQFKLYDVEYYWDHNHFRKATPREIKKYELKKTINKYNL